VKKLNLLESERIDEPLSRACLRELGLREETKKVIPHNTLLRSFGFAFQGVLYAVRTQRNMQIHLLIGVVVILAGLFFWITPAEWAGLLAVMALIYALEMINTVAEAIVDMVTEEYHPLAKVAKDVAAGAVLVAAIFAVGAGIAVFAPRLLHLLFNC